MRTKLVILLTIAALKVQAQIGQYRSELAIGANAGYAMSQLGFMPEVPQLWHGGATGGLTLRYTSEKYFSSVCAIVAEVNYAQIGWKEDILTPEDQPVINTVTGQPETYQRHQTYIQVPFFARLGWGRERKGLQFFFQAGPQVGFFLKEKTESSFNFANMNLPQRTSKIVAQDTMSVEHRIDYGISAGLGVEFSHPKAGHFMIEGRYYYGLGDIYGNSKRDFFGRSNFSNIIIKFTYLFDILKTHQDIK
mgnify:CR=1 FL=1